MMAASPNDKQLHFQIAVVSHAVLLINSNPSRKAFAK